MTSSAYNQLLLGIHRELQIPQDYAQRTGMPMYEEASLTDLVVSLLDDGGRPVILEKRAAKALDAMLAAATKDGITLLPFSGFRSYLYQRGLLMEKIKKGESIHDILKILAAPGHSEHHTGQAVDITTTDCRRATEEFEATAAYQWLKANAQSFGFSESFPRNNPHALCFEPWHWRFSAG